MKTDDADRSAVTTLSPLQVCITPVRTYDERLPPSSYLGTVSRGQIELLQVRAEREESVALVLVHFVGSRRS